MIRTFRFPLLVLAFLLAATSLLANEAWVNINVEVAGKPVKGADVQIKQGPKITTIRTDAEGHARTFEVRAGAPFNLEVTYEKFSFKTIRTVGKPRDGMHGKVIFREHKPTIFRFTKVNKENDGDTCRVTLAYAPFPAERTTYQIITEEDGKVILDKGEFTVTNKVGRADTQVGRPGNFIVQVFTAGKRMAQQKFMVHQHDVRKHLTLRGQKDGDKDAAAPAEPAPAPTEPAPAPVEPQPTTDTQEVPAPAAGTANGGM